VLFRSVLQPVVPIVDDLTAPLAPVSDGLLQPAAPVVDGLLSPLTPVVILPTLRGLPREERGDSGTTSSGSGSASSASGPPPSGPNTPRGSEAPVASGDDARSTQGLATPPALDLPATLPTGAPQLPTESAPSPLNPGAHAGLGPHDYTLSGWAAALQRQLQLNAAGTGFLGIGGPLSAAAAASPGAADAIGSGTGSTPSSGSLPAVGSGAAGSGAAGTASSALFALLVSFTAFALWHLARLLLTPARWRPQAFVAVLERPG
jgi:hypothetical protein